MPSEGPSAVTRTVPTGIATNNPMAAATSVQPSIRKAPTPGVESTANRAPEEWRSTECVPRNERRMPASMREARASVRAAGTAGAGQSGGTARHLYMDRTIEFPEQASTPLEPKQDITVPHYEYNRFSCAVRAVRQSAQERKGHMETRGFCGQRGGLPVLASTYCARLDAWKRHRRSCAGAPGFRPRPEPESEVAGTRRITPEVL